MIVHGNYEPLDEANSRAACTCLISLIARRVRLSVDQGDRDSKRPLCFGSLGLAESVSLSSRRICDSRLWYEKNGNLLPAHPRTLYGYVRHCQGTGGIFTWHVQE